LGTFRYTALSSRGDRVEGLLVGETEQAVLAELESRQLTPVKIEARAEASQSGRGVPVRLLGESYEQLADLLRAGVPLLRGLKLLGARRSRPRVGQVFSQLAQGVEKGSDLATAMNERPEVFAPVHVAMVRAGEKGGFLEEVLAQLGKLVVKQAELKAKVIGNMVYPMMLVVMGIGIGGVIFGVFVPKFRPMFDKMKGGLPFLTQVVFGASDAVTKYGFATAVLVAIAAIALLVALRKPGMKERLEVFKTRLPVIGPLIRGFATARLCRLLGTMLSNGVPMLAALQIAKDGAGNILMQRAVEDAAEAVKAGQHLAPPLVKSGLFDDDITEMISVGEAANNLDEVLVKIAETVESRLDRALGVAIRLIEPLLLVMLAGIVGIVAAALLLPLTKLSSSL